MTTLRTFQVFDQSTSRRPFISHVPQNEIDEHSREAAKQRALQAATTAEREKENKKPPPSKGKSKDEGPESPIAASRPSDTDTAELEDKILTALLSNNPDTARDLLAGLLTQHLGEYVFRIGLQPPHAKLFANELTDDCEGWTGVSRTQQELDVIHKGIQATVEEVGGKTSVLFETRTGHPRLSLLLRLPPPNVSLTPEVRCAVVGNVDSGKSTTLGVLTRGALDDGRGRARVGLFRHKHEIETGRTSSVGMEILGFSPNGAPILPNTANSTDPDVIRREKLGWEEISIQAAKIVSFIDLAGHERYLKTTLYGLTSGAPSCVILMVGANAGLIGMSKEHLAIALALSVPVVVCITKIDMTPPNVLAETIKQVTKILKSPGCRKTPVFVKSLECAVEVSTAFGKDRLCPIFLVSNVTGEGLDFQVRTFLNLLPSSEADQEKFAVNQPLEFSVTEVWSVPYVGTVTNGIINNGSIKTGDAVLLGPDSNGNYQSTVVKSMQRKRANVTTAEAGQCVSLALKRVRKAAVRKGMVLVHKTENPPKAVRQFEGQVLILYHNTTLQKNYQAMLHCGVRNFQSTPFECGQLIFLQAVRQTVRIIGMDAQCLRTGDRATVQFEFISHPEFIKEGMKLLFREGKTKGLGVITRLIPPS
ncbi:P-loop containing nucleoside triphosphate hydrolase protein [Mycena galopus ATCC 62051]|nr:P-loop containing nucleoside triphosphate hydrolase protein [Mycena galopus ATCC 62051]